MTIPRLTVAEAEDVVLSKYRDLSYPDLAADDLRIRISRPEVPADRAGAALLLLLLVVAVWRERRDLGASMGVQTARTIWP